MRKEAHVGDAKRIKDAAEEINPDSNLPELVSIEPSFNNNKTATQFLSYFSFNLV